MRTGAAIMLLCSVVCALHTAKADDDNFVAPGTSAAVDLGNYQTVFAYADGQHQANISRYGITFVQPMAPDVGFGLRGGYMTAGVNNASLNPLGDGYGPFLGLFAVWHPMLGNYWSLDFHAGYTWHDMSYSNTNQQADLTWYTSSVSLGPVLHLGPWRLAAGGYYQNFNATETDSGTLNQKLDFSAGRSTGVYFGFAYYLDRTGSVGIYASSGARRGVDVVFKREF